VDLHHSAEPAGGAVTALAGSIQTQFFAEQPVYLQAGLETIFGLVTEPSDPAVEPRVGVLLLHAGLMDLSHNRIWARAARALATQGSLCLRLDLHGSGESTGRLADHSIDGQTRIDVETGAAALRARGATHLIVVGSCWAGFLAMSSTLYLEGAVGSVAATPPLTAFVDAPASLTAIRPIGARPTHVLRQLIHPAGFARLVRDPRYAAWVAHRARRRIRLRRHEAVRPRTPPMSSLDDLRAASARGIQFHAVFGEQDDGPQRLRELHYQPLIDALGDSLQMRIVPGSQHALKTLAAQDFFLRELVDAVGTLTAELG
jgi:pimeloyl-ACP methyl ester carboxylesterase